jgi:hypothetical protein
MFDLSYLNSFVSFFLKMKQINFFKRNTTEHVNESLMSLKYYDVSLYF